MIGWVSDHRRHHAFADDEGDPHSPHGHGDGFTGTLRGLWHAHLGWLFDHPTAEGAEKHAPDLRRGPRHARDAQALRPARDRRAS